MISLEIQTSNCVIPQRLVRKICEGHVAEYGLVRVLRVILNTIPADTVILHIPTVISPLLGQLRGHRASPHRATTIFKAISEVIDISGQAAHPYSQEIMSLVKMYLHAYPSDTPVQGSLMDLVGTLLIHDGECVRPDFYHLVVYMLQKSVEDYSPSPEINSPAVYASSRTLRKISQRFPRLMERFLRVYSSISRAMCKTVTRDGRTKRKQLYANSSLLL